MTATIAAILALAGLLAAWWRRRAQRAEAARVVEQHRADTAEATTAADRAQAQREVRGELEAREVIPIPKATDPIAAIAEVDAARRKHDAVAKVKRKIARKP